MFCLLALHTSVSFETGISSGVGHTSEESRKWVLEASIASGALLNLLSLGSCHFWKWSDWCQWQSEPIGCSYKVTHSLNISENARSTPNAKDFSDRVRFSYKFQASRHHQGLKPTETSSASSKKMNQAGWPVLLRYCFSSGQSFQGDLFPWLNILASCEMLLPFVAVLLPA